MTESKDGSTLLIELPIPPSVNTYWGFQGHRRFLTLQAREFKVQVAHIVSQHSVKFGNSRIAMEITFHFKDKRRTDIDNYLKSLNDALCQAGLFDDDSQIDQILVKRGEIIRLGKTLVKIKSLTDPQIS